MDKYLRPYLLHNTMSVNRPLLQVKGLSLAAKMVYTVLCRVSSGKNYAFPSVATLCEELAISRDIVISALKDLVAYGFLERRRRGQGQTNIYYFLNHPIFQGFSCDTPDEPPEKQGGEQEDAQNEALAQKSGNPTSRSRESRFLEVEKADFKESGKPISRSRESRPVVLESSLRGRLNGRSDRSSGSSEEEKTTPPTNEPGGEYFEGVRNLLTAYMEGVLDEPADDVIVRKTIAAARGASLDTLQRFYRSLYQNDQAPKNPNGPRKYSWFPVVTRKHFEAPANPPVAHPQTATRHKTHPRSGAGLTLAGNNSLIAELASQSDTTA
jgi:hypothetical protein